MAVFPEKSRPPGWLPRFPQALSPLLGVLPRPWLNRVETDFLPNDFDRVPDAPALRQLWLGFSVALVKQTVYSDLYSCPSLTPAQEAVRSSPRRTGPMGFLLDLKADFFLVQEDSAPECRNWEESVGSNPATRNADLARARRFTSEIPRGGDLGHTKTPGEIALVAESVDWNRFKIVVSIDIAIPIKLRRRYPQVMWVYFPADPGTPTAKRARRRPPEGFSVSLTHTHRRFPVRPGLSSAAIECPYSFQSSFSWDQVWPSLARREGIMVEHQTYALLSEKQRAQLASMGTVRKPQGTVSEVAAMLRASKYYLRLQGGPLTGNGQVEAVMAGCLALGDPATYVQRSLFTPRTITPDFESAWKRLCFFESHPSEYQKARAEQLAVAEFVCFRRPAYQLLQHLHRHRRG